MKNKKILIIGGTGALGKTLIRQYQDSNDIRILSRDEHKQVALMSSTWVSKQSVSYMIGDVKDKDSIYNAINEYKPDVIINAAAMKHVPIAEYNPYESVNVNIIGHQNLLECISRSTHKIETVIYVSSDKACKPVNVYGMCKAISERLYVEFAKKQTDIKVCLVRYGNVLESTGSVIPYFKQLIEAGNDTLPITDMRMTRFLLTLDSAVDLISWAYETPEAHGCIAIPKVQSFKIEHIAKALIKEYKGDSNAMQLNVVGIRKGEKLHEEMISAEEWMRTIEMKNFLITDEIVTDECISYNSFDALMPEEDVYEFLKKTNVI
jgi:UDP-N-acetylglucosamine 4,6-dehydratase/5-epimerase